MSAADAGRYRKLLAALGAAAGVFAAAAADGQFTAEDIGQVVLAALGAFLVWRLPNDDPPATAAGRHRATGPE